jgi:hypothetical protein
MRSSGVNLLERQYQAPLWYVRHGRFATMKGGDTMRVKGIVLLAVFFIAAGVLVAGAEEKFGIMVYPGAQFDAETTKLVSQMGSGAACYRTSDSVAKVTEFFKRQPGIKPMFENKESAMLTNGTVNVTVQNPWMDTKTGKMNKDTLISIVNQ